MQWDLGLQGIGVLALLSLVFGIFTQAVFWGVGPRWLWLAAAALFFLGGLFISEVWFGYATEEELQPNIDGLSLDEVLLAYVVGVPLVLVARVIVGRRRQRVVS